MVKWQKKLLQLANSLSTVDPEGLQKITNATLAICGKSQRWDWSLHLFSCMTQAEKVDEDQRLPPADVISYGTMISIYGKQSEWKKSLFFLSACERSGLRADRICFNSAIDACGQGSQWVKASQLMLVMSQRCLKPDLVSISAVLASLARATRWQLALSLFWKSEMRETNSQATEALSFASLTSRRRSFDILGLSSAISACEKGRQWKAALELLATRQGSLDTISFGAAMVACEGCSQWEQVLDLLAQMSPNSARPNASCYSTATKAAASARRWQHALVLVMEASSYDLVDGFAWASLFSALDSAGQAEHLHPVATGSLAEWLDSPSRLRRGAELAECLVLAEWMRVLGIKEPLVLLRPKAPGASPSAFQNLESFASDMFENEGWVKSSMKTTGRSDDRQTKRIGCFSTLCMILNKMPSSFFKRETWSSAKHLHSQSSQLLRFHGTWPLSELFIGCCFFASSDFRQ